MEERANSPENTERTANRVCLYPGTLAGTTRRRAIDNPARRAVGFTPANATDNFGMTISTAVRPDGTAGARRSDNHFDEIATLIYFN